MWNKSRATSWLHSGNCDNPVSVIIWWCMSADGTNSLYVIDGTLNTRKYHIQTIPEIKLLPSISDLLPSNDSFIFHQGSAPCHTAKISEEWFCKKSIELLLWPGNGPDLNSIKKLYTVWKLSKWDTHQIKRNRLRL